MKETIATILILASIFIYVHFFVQKNVAEYKINVGKRVILNKDTLTIIDYSLFHENYILSNGTNVSKELIKTIPVIK